MAYRIVTASELWLSSRCTWRISQVRRYSRTAYILRALCGATINPAGSRNKSAARRRSLYTACRVRCCVCGCSRPGKAQTLPAQVPNICCCNAALSRTCRRLPVFCSTTPNLPRCTWLVLRPSTSPIRNPVVIDTKIANLFAGVNAISNPRITSSFTASVRKKSPPVYSPKNVNSHFSQTNVWLKCRKKKQASGCRKGTYAGRLAHRCSNIIPYSANLVNTIYCVFWVI